MQIHAPSLPQVVTLTQWLDQTPAVKKIEQNIAEKWVGGVSTALTAAMLLLEPQPDSSALANGTLTIFSAISYE